MIRAFKLEDLDSIMALWLETNRSAHSFIAEAYWQKNFDAVKDMMPSAHIDVYETEGGVQGFVGLMGTYIAGIFVSDKLQSTGVGKKLLDDVKSKHTQLSLHVYKKNERAVRFYSREGFSISSEQVDEHTGEVELCMSWTNG